MSAPRHFLPGRMVPVAPGPRHTALEARQTAWEHQSSVDALLHAENRLEMEGRHDFARQVRSIREAISQ
jgi:hypothetical protein